MTLRRLVAMAAVALLAGPAEARFGKKDSGSSSSDSSSSSSSSTSSSKKASTSTQTSSSSSSSSSGGDYHAAAPVGSGSGASYSTAPAYQPSWSRPRPWRYGFYSGAYVPRYGYGYGYYCPPSAYVGTAVVGTTLIEERQTEVREEPSAIRLDTGAEAMTFVNAQVGVTFGVHAHFEGERWGVAITGQYLTVRADDGSDGYDSIQGLGVHATFAFLSGKYGRLRAELGADTVFAPDLVMMGPTGGLSGSLWIGGPVALEGAVFVTPLPYKQLDYRAGVAVGVGAVGLRAGWRTQILDDNGVVDGVVHRDVFMGPYVGLSLVF